MTRGLRIGLFAFALSLPLLIAQQAHALDGFVRDAASGAAIEDATVVIGTERTTTDSIGSFLDHRGGQENLRARARLPRRHIRA